MKIGIFIPGRVASERLKNKLILPLARSCLWEIACEKLNNLPEKYNKYVLCFDEPLVEIANKFNNIKIIIRDKETTKVDGPLTYIFKELENLEDTHLMFLNPCLSLLTEATIIRVLEEFENSNKDFATSVKKIQNWLFDKDGKNLNEINYKRLSTKEINLAYQAAHCFHIFNKNKFFETGMMLKPGHGIIEIPHAETIDVDTQLDYEYAKFKLAQKYVFDIDNTICLTNGTDYTNAQPLQKRIDKINWLFDAGNQIWFQTARGYESGISWRDLTEYQLKQWNVKYHRLLMNKPSADIYVDDKAIESSFFFHQINF